MFQPLFSVVKLAGRVVIAKCSPRRLVLDTRLLDLLSHGISTFLVLHAKVHKCMFVVSNAFLIP